MTAILCECEKSVNLRLLTYLSEDLQDLTPITPAMFLCDRPSSETTYLDMLDGNHFLERLRFRMKMMKGLRESFRMEYLGQLVERHRQDPQYSNIQDRRGKQQKEQTLREFELQKIRLQNETQRVVGPQTLPQTKIELKKLLPTFNPEVDNMDVFLTLFERQMKLLDLGEDMWVPYHIGALPSDVTSLIAREPEEKCRDYSDVQGMLLQRFKLTAEKFRELFSRHRKSPNGKWKDYYLEIRAYVHSCLNELKIDLFDGLKNLIIAGQMKKDALQSVRNITWISGKNLSPQKC
ncbi:uncharacterized protein TNCV_355811 [Trichonephila clavipes]|nr:uncharacterized protein TNCV_355811 [Trichonephila clavipes]